MAGTNKTPETEKGRNSRWDSRPYCSTLVMYLPLELNQGFSMETFLQWTEKVQVRKQGFTKGKMAECDFNFQVNQSLKLKERRKVTSLH